MKIQGKAVAPAAASKARKHSWMSKECANYFISMEGIALNLSDTAKTAKPQLPPSVQAEIAAVKKIASMKDPPTEGTPTVTAAGLSTSSRSVLEDSNNSDGKSAPKPAVTVDDDTISSKNSASSDATSQLGGSTQTGQTETVVTMTDKAQDDVDGKLFEMDLSSTAEAQASTKPSNEVGAKANASVTDTNVNIEILGANSNPTNITTGTESANVVMPAAAGITGPTGTSAMLTSTGTTPTETNEQRMEQVQALLQEAITRQEQQQPDALAEEDIGMDEAEQREQEESATAQNLQRVLVLQAARQEEPQPALAEEDIGMDEANDNEEEQQREQEGTAGVQLHVDDNEEIPQPRDDESEVSNERDDDGDDARAHVAEEPLDNGHVLRVREIPPAVSTVAVSAIVEDVAGPALRTAGLQVALLNAAAATGETPAPAPRTAVLLPNTVAATVETPPPASRRTAAFQDALINAAAATRVNDATVTHDSVNADSLPVAKRTRSFGKPKDDGEAPEFPIAGITAAMAENINGTFYRKEGYIASRAERQGYVSGGLMGHLCAGDGLFTEGGAGGYDYTMGLAGDLTQRGSSSKKRRRDCSVSRKTKASLRALLDNEELKDLPKKELFSVISKEYEQANKRRNKHDHDDTTAGSP